jgi:hypothetical protein
MTALALLLLIVFDEAGSHPPSQLASAFRRQKDALALAVTLEVGFHSVCDEPLTILARGKQLIYSVAEVYFFYHRFIPFLT